MVKNIKRTQKGQKNQPKLPPKPTSWDPTPHGPILARPVSATQKTPTLPSSTRTSCAACPPPAPSKARLLNSPARMCTLPTRPTVGPRTALQPIIAHLSVRQWVRTQLLRPLTARHVSGFLFDRSTPTSITDLIGATCLLSSKAANHITTHGNLEVNFSSPWNFNQSSEFTHLIAKIGGRPPSSLSLFSIQESSSS